MMGENEWVVLRRRRRRLRPQRLARSGIVGRHDARHPDREQPVVGKHRRRLRARSMPGGRTHRGKGGGVRGAPDRLARLGIERAHHFLVALSREYTQGSRRRGGGVASAHVNLPPLPELLGPRRRRGEARRVAVAPPSRAPPRHCVTLTGCCATATPTRPNTTTAAIPASRRAYVSPPDRHAIADGTRPAYRDPLPARLAQWR